MSKPGSLKPINIRLKNGTLRVDIETGRVFSCVNERWRELKLIENHGYLYVQVCYNYRRRKISISRLVWMVANQKTYVPRGFDIDHKNHNTYDNCHTNLVLKPMSDNRSLNQYSSRFREAKMIDQHQVKIFEE